MAVDVIATLGAISTCTDLLGRLFRQVKKWRHFADRMLNIELLLLSAKASLRSWRRKYFNDPDGDVTPEMLIVLFGREGSHGLRLTLGFIDILMKSVASDMDKVVSHSLRPRSSRKPASRLVDNGSLAERFLRRVKRKTPWHLKFKYSVLGRADELKEEVSSLIEQVGLLAVQSESYLKQEHTRVSVQSLRISGRAVTSKNDDGGATMMGRVLRDAHSAQENAELLQIASRSSLDDGIRLGLYTVQIPKTNYAIALTRTGHTFEIVARPVKHRLVDHSTQVQHSLAAVVSSLYRHPGKSLRIQPESSQSGGFELYSPHQSIFQFQRMQNLSTCIMQSGHQGPTRFLYHHDQAGIAAGIAQGGFRLVGSRWLEYLSATNVHWRRDSRNMQMDHEYWTLSLAAEEPSDHSTDRTLESLVQDAREGRNQRDLTKHSHIFRIGLLLAEIGLNRRISYIDDETSRWGQKRVRLFISDLDFGDSDEPKEWQALEISNIIRNRMCNPYLADMVLACLRVLTERGGIDMSERELEEMYCKEVLQVSEEMEDAYRTSRRARGREELRIVPDRFVDCPYDFPLDLAPIPPQFQF